MNVRIRAIVLLIFLGGVMGTTSRIFGQTSVNDIIGLSCGFAGQPTFLVRSFKKRIDHKEYKHIEQFIEKGTLSQQCLAVMTCEMLEKEGVVKLSQAVRDKIVILYRSKQKVPICQGCTLGIKLSVDLLLNPRSTHDLGSLLREWILETYKKSIEK